MPDIQHYFVLMLENRSFDHMFGALHGLDGTQTCMPTPKYPDQTPVRVKLDAADITRPDPPHEFQDVRYQLTNEPKRGPYRVGVDLPMNGFAASAIHGLLQGESASKKAKLAGARGNGAYALRCQGPSSVPVLRQLAREFVLCKRWFSSMPGPTWPNRFFVHAASSGGLDNSPHTPLGAALRLQPLTFDFANGTLFDRLGEGGWRVYYKGLPQVAAIKGMAQEMLKPDSPFRHISLLQSDLLETYAPPPPLYTFIEPYHDIRHHARGANSQHPEARVSDGETLIALVYDTLRESRFWEHSALIITYDEHGGFFDRESPPETEPPGDDWRNHERAVFPARFNFDRLGVRVPAVIVSPWVDPDVDETEYEHSSIPRTILESAGRPGLTHRDEIANSFAHVFRRETPREDAPRNLSAGMQTEAVTRPLTAEPVAENSEDDDQDPDLSAGNLAGFLRIAADIDSELQTETQPLTLADELRRIARALPTGLATLEPLRITTRGQAVRYIRRIEEAVEARQLAAILNR